MRLVSAGLFSVLVSCIISGRRSKNASTDDRRTVVYVSGVSSPSCLGGDGSSGSISDYCTVMILICAVAYVIPGARQLLFSGGRLGGFFQYANTMALYILIAIVVHLFSMEMVGEQRKEKAIYFGKLLIMVAGLMWTGSRTTLAMFVLILIWFGIRQKRYKLTAGIIGGTAAAAVIALAAFGKFSSFARIFTISAYNSTFWGRFLYWQDAIPVILSHPFGIGYGGYMRIQPAIQTGVYVTRYIHNDYLQIALDHGIIAMLAFVALLIRSISASVKSRDELRSTLLIMIAVHAAWDFDLQYYAITALLLLLLFSSKETGIIKPSEFTENRSQGCHMIRVAGRFFDLRRTYDSAGSSGEPGSSVAAGSPGEPGSSVAAGSSGEPGSSGVLVAPAPAIALLATLMAVYLWLGLAQSLVSAGAFREALSLYPWDTVSEEMVMYYSSSDDEIAKHMDHILSIDPYSADTWRLMAFRASSYGEYDTMIDAMDRYLSIRKYDKEAYDDMTELLRLTADRLEEENDIKNAGLLRDHISVVEAMKEDVKAHTSPLAYKLRDLPEL